VYTCGPTVYAHQHIGNMRPYVFADTLRRVLEWKGHEVVHVINITDVVHLTSDMDEGDDKERAEARHRGDFAAADDIRRSLDQAGIELRDTPGGTVWKPRPAASGRPVRDDG